MIWARDQPGTQPVPGQPGPHSQGQRKTLTEGKRKRKVNNLVNMGLGVGRRHEELVFMGEMVGFCQAVVFRDGLSKASIKNPRTA